MSHRSSKIGTFLLAISIAAVLIILTMMFGAQMGLWEPIVGFGYIRHYMNPIAYGVVGISAVGFIYQVVTGNRVGLVKALLAFSIGMALLAPTIYSKINPTPRGPAINDITTDTENPPQFVALNSLRDEAKTSLAYGGSKVAAIQKKLYPNIAPLQTNLTAEAAYNRALDIAKEKGWEIVSQDADALRFEAIARTSVYAFKDDVVVVITALEEGSQLDMRSVSRIGRSDRGVNAARIMDFMQHF
ncbi:DUF1499 domain-containing protein [Vibrio ezurae]|uniref:DUF1499 domain-containing protein n=1 Tax=Vibrio ezurae NBRC 102218 TaxID=1219080 RepID=U3AKG7_9VIBR|nr:DUF1499 domain-containing protein [Vibrio ezurae]GAD80411.1 hypothetical protein VEZ01S_35_00320 [Vibrio ezurae NBRC 102218]